MAVLHSIANVLQHANVEIIALAVTAAIANKHKFNAKLDFNT